MFISLTTRAILDIESGDAVDAARTHKPRRNSWTASFSMILNGVSILLGDTHAIAKAAMHTASLMILGVFISDPQSEYLYVV
jgi:hypothetical protein